MHRVGQFMPVGAAKPVIGGVGSLEFVDEYRVETIVNDDSKRNEGIKEIIAELKQVRTLRLRLGVRS